MPSCPEFTSAFNRSCTACNEFRLFSGQFDKPSANCAAFAGSACNADTISTQSSADK